MFRFRHYLVFLLFATVAFTSYWIRQQDSKQPRTSQPNNTPVMFMKDFVAEQMNASGKLQHRLEGKLLRQIKHNEQTNLTQPKLTWYSDQGVPWQITAIQSIAAPDGSKISFEGDAEIKRIAASIHNPLRITSERFMVRPDEQTISSDLLVTIELAEGRATAVGFRAHFEDEEIHLLNQVEGVYVHAK